eukprot:Skav217123  [mRNA]  locus=scaffold783:297432:298460:+ [translate_table: standard]
MVHQYQSLWDHIVRHISLRDDNCISITKTKAHADPKKLLNSKSKWEAVCNNAVDWHAKQAILEDQQVLHARFKKLADRQVQRRHQLTELAQYVAEVANLACKRSKQSKRDKQRNVLNLNDPTIRQPATGVVHSIFATDLMYKTYPWGPIFLWRIINWAAKLKWPRERYGAIHYTDISYIELYLDFAIETATRSPRNIAKQNPGHWILDDIHIRPDTNDSPTLAMQTLTWTKAIKWLHKALPNFLWPAADVDRAYSLAPLGCSSWLRGISPRPILVKGSEAMILAHEFFTGSAEASRAYNRPIKLPFRPNHLHPEWMNMEHKDRIPYIRKAKTTFEERRQSNS